jgi:hypothetical protein
MGKKARRNGRKASVEIRKGKKVLRQLNFLKEYTLERNIQLPEEMIQSMLQMGILEETVSKQTRY